MQRGGSGLRCPTRPTQESVPLGVGKPERISQALYRSRPWAADQVLLDIAERANAHPGPLGELPLGDSHVLTAMAQEIAEPLQRLSHGEAAPLPRPAHRRAGPCRLPRLGFCP